MKNWYELESYGTFKQADPRSSADKRAQNILDSTTLHDGSRYSVGKLWADDNIHLPDNFYASLVQFKALEKRLEKDFNLKTQYASDIRSDVEKGYVVPVSTRDSKNRSDREWYLPHHPVSNPNKPSKVRRVLNGASKFHGKSLINSLLVAPICFRTFALCRTAVDNQDRYPYAAYAVLNIFYMDDYLGSVKNPETALMLGRSLVELLNCLSWVGLILHNLLAAFPICLRN